LTGKVKGIYEVLLQDEKSTFALANEVLGKHVQPTKKKSSLISTVVEEKTEAWRMHR